MDKPIRVRIMGRTYPLRVDPDDEAYTRKLASFVDAKMRAVRENFPGEPELTSAVIAALAIAEELMAERVKHESHESLVHNDLQELIHELDQTLSEKDVDGYENNSTTEAVNLTSTDE